MSSARAGWYVDPSTGTNLRYWSGSTWTDEVAPLPNEPMHSGPVDLFGVAVTAEESAITAEVPATIAVEASGIELVEPAPEPVKTESEQVGTEPEPEPVEAESEPVETQPEQFETDPAPAPPESGPAEAAAEPAEVAAEPESEPELASAWEPAPAGDNPVGDEPVAEALPIPDLDPEVEQTLLTRRELRARRGAHPELDDSPKHLPPITPPVAVPIYVAPEPVEEVEPPAQEPLAPLDLETDTGDDSVARRRRIVRLSVLLGILAVTSSVAVLTAGTL